MGTVETLVHLHDVAGGLGFAWQPDEDVVRRTLNRLFPQAPTDHEAWPTMLWATSGSEGGAGAAPSGEAAPAHAARRQEKSGPFSRDRLSS